MEHPSTPLKITIQPGLKVLQRGMCQVHRFNRPIRCPPPGFPPKFLPPPLFSRFSLMVHIRMFHSHSSPSQDFSSSTKGPTLFPPPTHTHTATSTLEPPRREGGCEHGEHVNSMNMVLAWHPLSRRGRSSKVSAHHPSPTVHPCWDTWFLLLSSQQVDHARGV